MDITFILIAWKQEKEMLVCDCMFVNIRIGVCVSVYKVMRK